MLSNAIEKAINEQINNEFYASYLYLSMASWCDRQNLTGFAGWLMLQSREETGHGMKFFEFLNDCEGTVKLLTIKAPPVEFKSMLNLFEQALEHEMKVTERINHLYDLAVKEKSFAVQTFLHWFLMEQIEEEKSARYVIGKLQLIANNAEALLMLDRELGERKTAD